MEAIRAKYLKLAPPPVQLPHQATELIIGALAKINRAHSLFESRQQSLHTNNNNNHL